MFEAAVKALAQMSSPPFRRVLLKAIGARAGDDRADRHRPATALFSWMADERRGLGRSASAPARTPPGSVLVWVLSIAADARHHHRRGVPDAGGDRLRRHVLRRRDRRRGRAHALSGRTAGHGAAARARALIEGIKTALLAIAGLSLRGAVPAVRRARPRHHVPRHRLSARPRIFPARGHALPSAGRGQGAAPRRIAASVFLGGLLIALFVSIPIVNLATPLFAMALMVHMHKRLSGRGSDRADRAEAASRSAGHALAAPSARLARPLAQVGDHAFLAQRPARDADVAAVQDQPVVRVQLVLRRAPLRAASARPRAGPCRARGRCGCRRGRCACRPRWSARRRRC